MTAIILFSVTALLLANLPAFAGETITGLVVGISDGDTLTLLDAGNHQHKIRLAGIDAPESKQAFGQASKKHLSGLVFNREVSLDCGKTDRYKRRVCVVNVGGRDANLAQIEAGMAWWYRKYQGEQTARQREDYEAAEGQARAAGRGLWQEPTPIPPWDFRAGSR